MARLEGSKTSKRKQREYICYDNRTDEVLALGTKEQCAYMLNVKVATFLSMKTSFFKRDEPRYKKRNPHVDIFEYDQNGNLVLTTKKTLKKPRKKAQS
ncbi:MAG: hypothetical protein DBY41_06665 [Clostridium sp.]|jgi:hypothetical protein|uniref:hypothetical protein n=1 Tax=Faecalibacillus intestinalis TaxID=1982626 RepID=UPI000D7A0720|nr:hypothetical protein [Faecalibacillus intestinalis]PWM79895.1 MAG: hypothetical protein DBY41_06665 [Clostridium sp.]RHP75309.1 hypothetical protein DXA62_06130 [Coprobacillus sp. OF03-2AA]